MVTTAAGRDVPQEWADAIAREVAKAPPMSTQQYDLLRRAFTQAAHACAAARLAELHPGHPDRVFPADT